MPHYLETDDRNLLKKLRLTQVCKECGGKLEALWDPIKKLPFLRCKTNPEHEGISREARQFEPNIPTRRKMMEEEHGEAKARSLVKYEGVVSLTKTEANEILTLVYPNAPDPEKMRAVALCASYGLNPLMGHVFLIPFKDKWATILGIKAKRLMASRRSSYSYVDGTPRVMTKEEQVTVFGEENTTHITAITKLRDPKTSAEAVGYGTWPKGTEPYGTDKGNSKANMAFIRSESQALDRLRPGEMPMGVDVMPEEAIDADYTVMTENPPEPDPEPEPEEPPDMKVEEGSPEVVQQDIDFDPQWLTDSLKEIKWSDTTVKSYLSNVCKVNTEGSVVEVVARLDSKVREGFFDQIQKGLDKKRESPKLI